MTISADARFTPGAVRVLLQKMGMTQDEMARYLGMERNTFYSRSNSPHRFNGVVIGTDTADAPPHPDAAGKDASDWFIAKMAEYGVPVDSPMPAGSRRGRRRGSGTPRPPSANGTTPAATPAPPTGGTASPTPAAAVPASPVPAADQAGDGASLAEAAERLRAALTDPKRPTSLDTPEDVLPYLADHLPPSLHIQVERKALIDSIISAGDDVIRKVISAVREFLPVEVRDANKADEVIRYFRLNDPNLFDLESTLTTARNYVRRITDPKKRATALAEQVFGNLESYVFILEDSTRFDALQKAVDAARKSLDEADAALTKRHEELSSARSASLKAPRDSSLRAAMLRANQAVAAAGKAVEEAQSAAEEAEDALRKQVIESGLNPEDFGIYAVGEEPANTDENGDENGEEGENGDENGAEAK